MGKKVLKRSLVLGALMAFVITGNAWAANSAVWEGADALNDSISEGKVTADIQDTVGNPGNNVAYLVTGNNEIVNAKIIDINAEYLTTVTPKGEVAAVLLNGTESNKVKTTLEGEINFSVYGNSKWRNHGVFLNGYGDYTQTGHLNMVVIEANSVNRYAEVPAIHALSVGEKSSLANGYNNAKIKGDINLDVFNSKAQILSVVNVAAASQLIHDGNINFYAENFGVVRDDSELLSGIYCNNNGVATLNGNVNMTLINKNNNPNQASIIGAQLLDGTLNHETGDINMSFAGDAGYLFHNPSSNGDNHIKGGTISAYIVFDKDGESQNNIYNSNANSVATLSFGATDKDGNNVEFNSSEIDSMKWSFANFDIVKVTEGSNLHINSDQISEYRYGSTYANAISGDGGFKTFTPVGGKIHSADGAINLGDNTMILENNATATMDKLTATGATVTVGKGAKLETDEFDGSATFVVDVSDFYTGNPGYAITVGNNNAESSATIKASNLNLQGGAANALKNAKSVLEKTVFGIENVTYGTEATDSALYGDVKLNEDGETVTTTMDTKHLIVSGNVDAVTFNGLAIEDLAKSEDVNTKLAGKANVATSLAGYGISDAYTRDEVEEAIDKKLAGAVVNGNIDLTSYAKVSETYTKVDNVTIDQDGITVGANSTRMDAKGFYAGGDKPHNYQNAKAAMTEDGKIKGAGGKFEVGEDGSVKAAEGKFKVDADGNVTAANLYTKTEVDDLVGSGSSAAIDGINQRLGKLTGKINKVGAGAAALAALHPLDFDPDDKLSFSAGVGNYAGENAAALGMFYRPNEKVMLSMGGTVGNDEEMVNLGISFALDKPNNVSNGRVAMAKELISLREHIANQDARLAKQDEQIAQLVMLVKQLTGKDVEVKAEPTEVLPKEGSIRVERLTDGYEEYDRVRIK